MNYDKLRKRVLSLSRFTFCITAFAILLSLLLIYYYGHVTCFGNRLYPFFILSGVTSIFLLTKCMLERNACGKIESFFVLNKDKCFFIFAFHSIILSYIDALMYSLMPHNWFFYLVIFIMAPIIDVAICLFTYSLLQKSCQPVLRVLSGGR